MKAGDVWWWDISYGSVKEHTGTFAVNSQWRVMFHSSGLFKGPPKGEQIHYLGFLPPEFGQ